MSGMMTYGLLMLAVGLTGILYIMRHTK